MRLFHGSDHIVGQPVFGEGKIYNDYGRGFYCTEDEILAKEWAVGEDKDGYVNIYELNVDHLSIINLNDNEYIIMHWLSVLLENRRFDMTTPIEREAKKYILDNFKVNTRNTDLIIGYRADDSYFSYAKDFISGTISYEQLCKAIVLGDLGTQVCLKSKNSFKKIQFIDSYRVKSEDWFSKKQLRDTNARAGYRSLEKDTYHKGELYISRILDEELKIDDLRIRQNILK